MFVNESIYFNGDRYNIQNDDDVWYDVMIIKPKYVDDDEKLPLTEEGHNVPLPLPQLLVGDMLPNKIAPLHKRKYAVHTPSMDNDSTEIITRAKGLVGSRANSIPESGKKNDE